MISKEVISRLCPSLKSSLENKEVKNITEYNLIYNSSNESNLYRIVFKNNGVPLNSDDFLSHVELRERGILLSKKFRNKTDEQLKSDMGCHSVSLFSCPKLLESRIKVGERGKSPSMIFGLITGCHGLLTDCEEGHVHWWRYKEIDPCILFNYCQTNL